jgi:hypothetical protein
MKNLAARVAELERSVARLIARQAGADISRRAPKPQVRLAMTQKDPNTNEYPPPGATAYWVTFVDGEYDDSDDGQPSLTVRGRSGAPIHVANRITGGDLPENSLVPVVRANGRWWIVVGGPTTVLGKTNEPIDKGDEGSVSIFIGPQLVEYDSGMNVIAANRFGDVEANKWVMVTWNGHGWYLIAREC